MRKEETYWRQILKRLFALVQVLGAQNLALRGTTETSFTPGNGNFLKFLEFLALFDPIMHEHPQKVQNKDFRVHYLGKNIQNEIINLFSSAIQDEIVKSARSAKYFSIILDCTPDVGHEEQMAIVIRFVTLQGDEYQVKEHFLGLLLLLLL